MTKSLASDSRRETDARQTVQLIILLIEFQQFSFKNVPALIKAVILRLICKKTFHHKS